MNPKFKRILQIGLILLILVNLISFNRNENFDYKSLYVQIFFLAVFIFWLLGIIKGYFCISKDFLNKLVFAFFLINLAYFFLSMYRFAAALQFYNVFVYAGVYFIFLSAFTNTEDLKKFLNWLIFGLFLASVYGILQYLRLDPFKISGGAVLATFVNPNFFAGFLAIGLPYCLGKIFLARRISGKLVCLFMSAVVFCSLILTGSKGGIISGLSGALTFVILTTFISLFARIRTQVGRNWLFLAIIASAIFLAIAAGFAFDIYDKTVLASLKERQDIWQVTVDMIKKNIFWGKGIGEFALWFPEYRGAHFCSDQFIRHACNEFLELWAELGFSGLLMFAAILIFVSINSLRLIFTDFENINVRFMRISALSSLWAGIALNSGDINLRIVYLGVYFWLTLAFLNKVNSQDSEARPLKLNFSPPVKNIAFLAVIISGLATFKYILTPLIMYKTSCGSSAVFLKQNFKEENGLEKFTEISPEHLKFANIQFNLGNSYARQEKWNQAIDALENAVRIDPQFLPAYNNLGNVYLLNGEIDKAIGCYLKALSLNPRYLMASYNLGYAYLITGNIREAYERFILCLKINPRDADSFFIIKRRILY